MYLARSRWGWWTADGWSADRSRAVRCATPETVMAQAEAANVWSIAIWAEPDTAAAAA